MPRPPFRAVAWALAAIVCIAEAAPARACWFNCCKHRSVKYADDGTKKVLLCCDTDDSGFSTWQPADSVQNPLAVCEMRSPDDIGTVCAKVVAQRASGAGVWLCWDPTLQGWRYPRP